MKSKNRSRMLLILGLALSMSCTVRRSINDGETLRWGQSLEPEYSPQVDWKHMAMSAVQVCRNYDPRNGPSLLSSGCSTGIVLKDGYVLAALHALGYIDQIRPKHLPKDKVLIGSVIQENYGVLIPSIRKGKTGEFRSPPTFQYDIVGLPAGDEVKTGRGPTCNTKRFYDTALLRVKPSQLAEFERWTYPFKRSKATEIDLGSPFGARIKAYGIGFTLEPYRENTIAEVADLQENFTNIDTVQPNFLSGVFDLSDRDGNHNCHNVQRLSGGGGPPDVLNGFSGGPIFDENGHLIAHYRESADLILYEKKGLHRAREEKYSWNQYFVRTDKVFNYFGIEDRIDFSDNFENERLAREKHFNELQVHLNASQAEYDKEIDNRLDAIKKKGLEYRVFNKGRYVPKMCVFKNFFDADGIPDMKEVDGVHIKFAKDMQTFQLRYRLYGKINKWKWSPWLTADSRMLVSGIQMPNFLEWYTTSDDRPGGSIGSILNSYYIHREIQDKEEFELYWCN